MLFFFTTAPPCNEGRTFQQCGPLCPQTCDNNGAACTGGCAEGCVCPMGQVINDEGNCTCGCINM